MVKPRFVYDRDKLQKFAEGKIFYGSSPDIAIALCSALKDLLPESPFPFIEYLVYIEDKTSPQGKSLFKLWPSQREVIQAFLKHRLVAVVKARQLGLTWLALAYAAWRMLTHPGYTVVAISKSEKDAIHLVDVRLRHFIFGMLPKWLIVERHEKPDGYQGLWWEATAHELCVYHPGGMISRFLAESAAPDSGRSLTANLVILDEWAFQQYADKIWSAAYHTINRPGANVLNGQVIGISTGEPGTLFERIVRGAPENGFHVVFLPWYSDPRRDTEWYERTKREDPVNFRREAPATLDDAFYGGGETAFPQFDPRPGGAYVCKPFRIPDYWKRWRANDPGYGEPYAWYWFAQAPDGRIFVYREFARPATSSERIPWSEQARRVAELSVLGGEVGEPEYELGLPRREKLLGTAVGWDAWRTDPEQGKGPVDYYRENGVGDCIQAPADKIGRYAAVVEGFKVQEWPDNEVSKLVGRVTAKVMIFDTCRLLIDTLPRLITDPNNPNRVKECDIDHYYEALGMGLQIWGPGMTIEPKPEPTRIQKRKAELARRLRQRRLAYAG